MSVLLLLKKKKKAILLFINSIFAISFIPIHNHNIPYQAGHLAHNMFQIK